MANDNSFIIKLQAMLDKVKSIANIKVDIKNHLLTEKKNMALQGQKTRSPPTVHNTLNQLSKLKMTTLKPPH